MKFVTDGMLGRLTRWLRLAGQDVVCVNDYQLDPKEEDEFLLLKAKKSSRILITRDTDLHRRALREGLESVLLTEKGDIPSQMLSVSESVGEDIEVNIGDSRCPVCNGELESIEKPLIEGDVPGMVLKNHDKFWRCEGCGKIYWSGGHWSKMRETVDRYESLKG